MTRIAPDHTLDPVTLRAVAKLLDEAGTEAHGHGRCCDTHLAVWKARAVTLTEVAIELRTAAIKIDQLT